MVQQRIGNIEDFWKWAKEEYSPEQIATLERDQTQLQTVMDFYAQNIYKPPPLPPGRPQEEKYGITESDWQTLMALPAQPEIDSPRIRTKLEEWLERGYINEYQARDIWEELTVRVGRAQAGIIGGEQPAERQRRLEAERVRQEQEWAGRPAGMKLTPEAYTEYVESQAWRGARPEVEYGTSEEQRFAVPQTERWRDWFRSKYPRLVEQFQATLPEFERKYYPGLGPKEASKQIEKGWAEWFRTQKPAIKEEWYKLGYYGRGETPGRHAPRITKVGF